jgi:transcriptional regulator with XRE-family HTH domain
MKLILLRLRVESCYGPGLITGRQLKAARAMLGIEQSELARRARVARGTVRRMESFEGEVGSRTSTLSQVQATLERAGIEFLGGDQPGVRLKKPSAKPPRAS